MSVIHQYKLQWVLQTLIYSAITALMARSFLVSQQTIPTVAQELFLSCNSVFSVTYIVCVCVCMRIPGAESACPQANEHGADEFAEGGGVDGLEFGLLTVQQVVIVQRAARQTHTLRLLIVIQQPLHLHTHIVRTCH